MPVNMYREDEVAILIQMRRKWIPISAMAQALGRKKESIRDKLRALGLSYPVGKGRKKEIAV